MKNSRKRTFIILFVTLFIILGGFFVYRLLQDENKLTVTEKQFITSNDNKNINVNVINDVNIFGSNGVGLYYDFLNSVEEEYNLSFNYVTTKSGDSETGEVMLTKASSKPSHATLIYTDHYVLVSKTSQNIGDVSKITGDVGVVTGTNLNNITNSAMTIKDFKTKDEVISALDNGDVVFIIVPRIEFIDSILSKGYYINYHFSDMKDYYYLNYNGTDGEILASIMSKYLNGWQEAFDESFYSNEFKTFTSSLKISEKEIDKLNNKVYTYGFISNPPYDVYSSKTYGGIMKEYLDGFAKMGGIEIKYKPYKNLSRLKKAINKKDINLYTDYYGINSDFTVINTLYNADISIVMGDFDDRVYTSLEGIKNEKIYAKKNTLIEKYLSNNGIKVKTYRKTKDIKKLLEKGNIVAIDKYEYEFYQKGKKLNSSIRFTEGTNQEYSMQSSSNASFNKLLASYINYIDKNEVTYNGLDSAAVAEKYGKMIYRITKYAAFLIIGILAITYILYRHGKKIHIKKKIKKADKIKYVDLLTSLKNRNYLNENIPVWNRNTIYPQAVIVANLNEVQNLNDDYGYEAGDKQIKAVANVLIKTQLDNSEIMRADGNEFIIYLVGYSEKRVLSYIKKLNKEFKNLPYDRGVAIGFSIIDNDLKLVDDAINEATEKMKGNKELMQGETDEKEDK